MSVSKTIRQRRRRRVMQQQEQHLLDQVHAKEAELDQLTGWRSPYDNRFVTVDNATELDDLAARQDQLLVHYGIEVQVAEYHHELADPEFKYVYRYRRRDRDGQFSRAMPTTAERLKAETTGIYFGAAEHAPEISDTLDWLPPEDATGRAWPQTQLQQFRHDAHRLAQYHGLTVDFAECPDVIRQGLEAGHHGTGPRRWYMLRMDGYRGLVMDDLQVQAFLNGLRFAGMHSHRRPEPTRPSRWQRLLTRWHR